MPRFLNTPGAARRKEFRSMISALTGELREVSADRVQVQVGPLVCELLIAAADGPRLGADVGQAVMFHTLFYIEGDASGGNLEPRLIGFLSKQDKQFFEKFITVKGIGPKKALRALAEPVGAVARAIESRDTRFLVKLPQIGKRMAEQIVAELAGKVTEFAAAGGGDGKVAALPVERYSDAEEDAIAALVQLGERRSEAMGLLDRAKLAKPELATTDGLLREMLRLRTSRS